MAGFNLGNLATALQMTGNTKLADELLNEAQRQPAQAETPVEMPAESQPAPAPPAPTETQPPRPAPAETAPQPQIEDKRFNPNASARTLRGELTDAQNRALELVEQTGDDKRGGAIRAEGAQRQADVYGELERERKARLDDALGRVATNRAQKDAFERDMLGKLDSIAEREKHPPKDIMGMVMGILGAAMASKGNAAGAAVPALIGQAIGSKTDAWKRELESDKSSVDRMKKMFDLQNEDSNNELTQEQKIADLTVGRFDAALKQVASETDSKELKSVAEQARNDLRSKYVAHQADINARQQAAQSNDALWKMSIEDLSRAMAEGRLGKQGQAVLADKIKREQGVRAGEAEIEGKLAGAEKSRAEARDKERQERGETQGSEVVGGYQIAKPEVWASVPAPNRASFAKGAAAVPGLVSSLTELRDLVKAHGTENMPGTVKSRMQALQADVLGSIKEANELGALDNGVRALVEQQTGDPTAWNFGLGNWLENADAKLDATIAAVQRGAASKAAAYGLESKYGGGGGTGGQAARASAPPAQAPSPTPAQAARATTPTPQQSTPTPGVVTVYRKDGTPIPVRADLVEEAVRRGYSASRPAMPSGPGSQALTGADQLALLDASPEMMGR